MKIIVVLCLAIMITVFSATEVEAGRGHRWLSKRPLDHQKKYAISYGRRLGGDYDYYGDDYGYSYGGYDNKDYDYYGGYGYDYDDDYGYGYGYGGPSYYYGGGYNKPYYGNPYYGNPYYYGGYGQYYYGYPSYYNGEASTASVTNTAAAKEASATDGEEKKEKESKTVPSPSKK